MSLSTPEVCDAPQTSSFTSIRTDEPAAPPWLWFWLCFFISGIGGYWAEWRRYIDQFRETLAGNDRMAAAGAPVHLFDTIMLIPPWILDFLPSLGLLITVGIAFFPRLRASYLERRFRLRPLEANMAALQEIRDFVLRHDSSLGLVINPTRLNQIAFVYPTSARRANLALFGGLLKLWHSDRPAGEAVLLHEIAHHRRGDAWIMGTGSLFHTFIKYLPLAWLLLFIVPTIATSLVGAWRGFAENQALNAQFKDLPGGDLFPMGKSVGQQIGIFLKVTIPGLVFTLIGGLALHANRFVMPILGIWAAELSADRVAAYYQGTRDHVSRVLSSMNGTVSRWQKLLFCVYHPPMSLRRRILCWSDKKALIALLLVYPAGIAIKFVLFQLFANGSYLSSLRFAHAAKEFIPNCLLLVRGYPIPVGMMGLFLLAWPFISAFWVRLFTGQKGQASLRNLGVYVTIGTILLVFAATSWLVSRP